MVRIASLMTIATVQVPIQESWSKDDEDSLQERNEVYDNLGGDVPSYDERGRSVVKTTKITVLRKRKLDKKQKIASALAASSASAQPLKLYDIGKLKLETFQKVLEFITDNLDQGRMTPPQVPPGYEQMHQKIDLSG